MISKDLQEKAALALKAFTPREEQIIRMRFGFDGDEHTLEEVGETLGLTRERIRQIEKQVMRNLRNSADAQHLHNLFAARFLICAFRSGRNAAGDSSKGCGGTKGSESRTAH